MKHNLLLLASLLSISILEYGICLVKWSPASESVFSEAYSPYELCVLQLAPDFYDVKNNIFDQPSCRHLIDDNLRNLPTRCWLGGLHQPHDTGLCIGTKMMGNVNKNRKCSQLAEKKGLRNGWSKGNYLSAGNESLIIHPSGGLTPGLTPADTCRVQFGKYPGYAAAVLRELLQESFEVIAFAG
jgi:hypothetical protein